MHVFFFLHYIYVAANNGLHSMNALDCTEFHNDSRICINKKLNKTGNALTRREQAALESLKSHVRLRRLKFLLSSRWPA